MIELTPKGTALRASEQGVPASLAEGLDTDEADVVELRSRVRNLVAVLQRSPSLGA